MQVPGFAVFALLLSLVLLSQARVSAVPLDAVEKRALEERQDLLRSSSAALRQNHFQNENVKKVKGKRKIEVYPQPAASGRVSPREVTLKPPPEPAVVQSEELQEEFRIDAEKPPPAPVLPPPSESRVVFDAGAVDTTDTKYVRSTSFNVGLGYKVTEQAMLGLEAQREINDPYDADAGRASEEDQSMNVRYKFQF